MFEVQSVNNVLAPILVRVIEELRNKLFLKELINDKQGKLELNLGRYAQPERIKFSRFEEGLYSVILAHNQLTALPPHMCHDLRSLHSLRLDDNKFTEFPVELAPLNLARLRLVRGVGDHNTHTHTHRRKRT